MLTLLEHFAVAVCAASGVLAAQGRRVDLFGVIVLALVTAFGGGTIRDLCLGATPVFWISNQDYVLTALIAALGTFLLARRYDPPMKFFELADAFGLALFALMGTAKGLSHGAGGVIAVALGTITGVAGGVVRDVLLNELPLVFRREIRLYATAAIAGAAVFTLLRAVRPQADWAILVGMGVTLLLRLAAIRWELSLPEFAKRTDS